MTQQQNTRKTFPSLARENNVRAPLHTKASGDSSKEKTSRIKSKTKVPKSMRYDLENALVSLCDVWFEEIKPYLMRNNIKVHVHEDNVELAAGDRHCPPSPTHCSHLDPGAASDHHRLPSVNCVGCCSTQQTASRVPCRKPRVCPPPLPEPRTAPSTQSPCRNAQENSVPKSRRRRRRRRASHSQTLAPSTIVPRLCRTYSIVPNIPKDIIPKKVQENRNKTVSNNNCLTESILKPKQKNKLIQTEKLSAVESKTTGQSIYLKSKKLRSVEKENDFSQNKMSPLFKKDLIDIIAEKHDKGFEILFQSPVLSQCPSTMNLLPSPKNTRQTSAQKKPWK